MNEEAQAALDAVMNFLDSYAKGDIEQCMTAIATSRTILLFGTNANEVFRTAAEVRAAFRRDFDSMSNIRWGERRNLQVEATPTLASVMIELPISYQSEGKETETLFRYALALVRENERWKVSAGLVSVPFSAGTYVFS